MINTCVTSWNCGSWSSCSASGVQTRPCIDSCNSNNTKTETQSCNYTTGSNGNGLKGSYYKNRDLSGSPLVRTDSTVNFSWGSGSPDPSIPDNNFSVRWEGQIKIPATGTYTFTTYTDDGVRLWVNNQQLINSWKLQTSNSGNSGSVYLTAGTYPIKMEYFEDRTTATAKLFWKGPNITQEQAVPQAYLYSETISSPAPVPGTGLKGSYYNVRSFSGSPSLVRTDATVDFNWGSGSPDPSIPTNEFAVRWEGQVEIPADGTYTFTAYTDDGANLWVNGQQIISNWKLQSVAGVSGSVNLSAGKYPIKMEYFEAGSGAIARLLWKVPGSTSSVVIPQQRLYPN